MSKINNDENRYMIKFTKIGMIEDVFPILFRVVRLETIHYLYLEYVMYVKVTSLMFFFWKKQERFIHYVII